MQPAGGEPRHLVVSSVLAVDDSLVQRCIASLTEQVGPLAYLSDPAPFEWSNYYSAELGDRPLRRWAAFDALASPTDLVELKRTAARLEVALRRPGAPRRVNVDPGLLDEHQLLVASTKHRAHRIHLGRGIHLDLMLFFDGAEYAALPWTYPDYAAPETRAMFGRLRAQLLTRRRQRARLGARAGSDRSRESETRD